LSLDGEFAPKEFYIHDFKNTAFRKNFMPDNHLSQGTSLGRQQL